MLEFISTINHVLRESYRAHENQVLNIFVFTCTRTDLSVGSYLLLVVEHFNYNLKEARSDLEMVR